MNLLETIQQNRQKAVSEPAQVTDETSKIQTLLKAKSGRAPLSSDTGVSNLGEQAAVAQTNNQLAQAAQQNQIQTQQENIAQAAQQQEQAQQKQAVAQARKFDNLQTKAKTQSILSDLEREKGGLDLEKDRARLEQASFLLSMQDKQYTDQLEAIGAKRRFDDELAFKQEMQNIAFKDSQDILKQKLGNADILSASDREFQQALSKMNIQDAVAIAGIEAKYAQQESDFNTDAARWQANQAALAANQQAKWQAAGQLAGAATQAYGQYADNAAKKEYYTTGKGKDSTSFEASQYRKK